MAYHVLFKFFYKKKLALGRKMKKKCFWTLKFELNLKMVPG